MDLESTIFSGGRRKAVLRIEMKVPACTGVCTNSDLEIYLTDCGQPGSSMMHAAQSGAAIHAYPQSGTQ